MQREMWKGNRPGRAVEVSNADPPSLSGQFPRTYYIKNKVKLLKTHWLRLPDLLLGGIMDIRGFGGLPAPSTTRIGPPMDALARPPIDGRERFALASVRFPNVIRRAAMS